MNSFTSRIVRASKLDASLYEEVEADRDTMGQAIGVVILASIAAGLGSYSAGGAPGIIMGALTALLGWIIWAFITYWIGAKMLPETQTDATPGQLLRTIGFASSPGLIRIIGIIPGLMAIVFFVAGVWMLVAMVIAVRQALDYQSTFRALGVVLIGWLVQAVIMWVFFFMIVPRPV